MSAAARITLHVGNLSHSATAEDLLQTLRLRADRASVELATARDRPERRLGFGFVTVPAEVVEEVLKCDGAELGGRNIRVSLARRSDQSKPGRWQKSTPSGSGGVSVTKTTPKRGIPQDVLDRLQSLRLRLEAEKKAGSDEGGGASGGVASPSRHLLVDVGANLTNFRFKGHVEEVVERALAAGVHKVMVTGTNAENSQLALLLAQSLPGVLYCTAGVHPHDAKHWDRSLSDLLEGLLANPEVVAVGETGLDYNRMFSSQSKQLEAFSAQVEIACKFGKPLFLHEREAHSDLVSVLSRFKDRLPPTLIHCFTGTEAEAAKYIELGYFIGLTGFVCKRERGRDVRVLLRKGVIPLARLVIETDAPFMLPPLPARDYNGLNPRSRDNEPCTLPLVVKAVAELCGVSEEEVADRTAANAIELFKL